MKLTAKQRAFIDAYLTHMNASRAAREAGYSPKTAYAIGHENLRKPEIQEAIQTALAERTMSADEVLARLSDQARGDMADFAHIATPDDVTQHDQARLIKKFRRTLKSNGDEVIEIELYDAQAALEKIGRYHRLFIDRQELTGADGGPLHIDLTQMSDEDLERLAAGTG